VWLSHILALLGNLEIMSTILYHNPQCSKSRATMGLLDEKGVETEVIEYLKTPPNADELRKILAMLGMEAHQLVRDGDAKKIGLDYKSMDEDVLIDEMVKNPILIQRPLVVSNGKAGLGRPPEDILKIL
jgi:arsenate reductase